MQSIALKVNRSPETLRIWVRYAEINEGARSGATDEMAAENKRLQQKKRAQTGQ